MTNAPRNSGIIGRRALLRSARALPLLAAGCGERGWHAENITGSMPALEFSLRNVVTGQETRAADFRGKVALLTFGYTACPDVCPTTLGNLAVVLQDLGKRADDVRVLFVTVDPERDTPTVLRGFVALFAPQVIGLRGTPDQLASLARRYRVAYSVTRADGDQPYEVTHSALVFVFDPSGRARLLIPSLATPQADIAGVSADLKRLLAA